MATSTRDEIRVGDMTIRFLLEGEQSVGSVAIFEFDVPAGAKIAAAHSHDGYDETIYGLDGVLTWSLEGTSTEVGPGETFFIPAAPSTTSTTPARSMRARWPWSRPGFSGPPSSSSSAVLDAATEGPPDVAAIGAVMRRHGLTPAA